LGWWPSLECHAAEDTVGSHAQHWVQMFPHNQWGLNHKTQGGWRLKGPLKLQGGETLDGVAEAVHWEYDGWCEVEHKVR
jgi:hypothetical protein